MITGTTKNPIYLKGPSDDCGEGLVVKLVDYYRNQKTGWRYICEGNWRRHDHARRGDVMY